MVFKNAFLILILLVSTTAQPSDWMHIATDATEREVFVDLDSIEKDDSFESPIRVWTKLTYGETKKNTRKIDKIEEKTLVFVLCKDQKIKIQQSIITKNKIVISTKNLDYSSYYYASPDSIGLSILNTACIASHAKDRFFWKNPRNISKSYFIRQALRLDGDTDAQDAENAEIDAEETNKLKLSEYKKAIMEFFELPENTIFKDAQSFAGKTFREEYQKLADQNFGSREILRIARKNTVKILKEDSPSIPLIETTSF